MKKTLYYILFLSVFVSCTEKKSETNILSTEDNWLGQLIINETNAVHFNFSFNEITKDSLEVSIYNGDEVLKQPVKKINDSLFFNFPVFDKWFKLKLVSDSLIEGEMTMPSKGDKMKFVGKINSSLENRNYSNHDANNLFTGKWKVKFNDGGDYADAIGVFNVSDKNAVGTFLTETGDYRYLQGSTKNDSIYLSCFDGAHVFLFKAKVFGKDSISGDFYSGANYKDSWSGRKNANFELRRADTITKFIGDSTRFSFEFPDVEGVPFIYPNPIARGNNITLIQLMGTWCPNCKDEVVYYQELMRKYDDITVVALCFEHPNSFEEKAERVKQLQKKYNIEYPLLIAGNVNKQESSDLLPFLNHVVSYPTTVIVDKTGKVRRVHTGFYGPGTGDYYVNYKSEMESFLETLR